MNKSRTYQFPPGAVRVTRWDTADYLENLEDVTHYLEAAFEDGDPHLIAEAIGNVARAKGMTAIATKTGLGRESLYKALSSSGNPKLITIISVLRAVGIRLQPTAISSLDQENYGTESTCDSGRIVHSISESNMTICHHMVIRR